MYNYKELKTWQLAMQVVVDTYVLCEKLPSDEQFGLTSQIKRSAISIPSNIAEGAGRNTNKEFERFLNISNGSNYELETQLLLAEKLFDVDSSLITKKLQEIQKMTYALKKSFSHNK